LVNCVTPDRRQRNRKSRPTRNGHPAGRLPYDVGRFNDAARVVREVEPAPLGTVNQERQFDDLGFARVEIRESGHGVVETQHLFS